MKKIIPVFVVVILWLAAFGIVVTASGCGVIMNAQYSELLDKTVALSAETAERAKADELSEAQMVEALELQAGVWKRFQDAREGRE